MPRVVSNSGSLIALAEIDRFPLLKQLFGEVSIPPAVYREVVVDGAGQPGAKETAEADWIKTVEVQDRLAVDLLRDELGPGQSEAIVLATELSAETTFSSMTGKPEERPDISVYRSMEPWAFS